MNPGSNKSPSSINARFLSLDVLRGAVMALMAIDHVRVYSGLPAGGPSAGIFFTRWVTHFCAPAFVFLAGTSAFLYGNKFERKDKLVRFLISRGLLLVILELTLIRFSWTFNFDYSNFTLAGVVWMLGWCMVMLAALVRLRPEVVGILGLVIIFFQQLFGLVPGILPSSWHVPVGQWWEFIYPSGVENTTGISILYVLVPWIGVMAAGYGFGAIMKLAPAQRNKICLQIGLTAILLFLVLGSFIILSRPAISGARPFIYQLLNQKKYPPTPLFLMMTLGPLIALIPFAEKTTNRLTVALRVMGSVPLFYYLVHIPLIHLSALIVNFLREGTIYAGWYASAPFALVPEGHQWSLLLLYVVFAIDLTILFFACRWYAKYKSTHPEKKWLKYI